MWRVKTITKILAELAGCLGSWTLHFFSPACHTGNQFSRNCSKSETVESLLFAVRLGSVMDALVGFSLDDFIGWVLDRNISMQWMGVHWVGTVKWMGVHWVGTVNWMGFHWIGTVNWMGVHHWIGTVK